MPELRQIFLCFDMQVSMDLLVLSISFFEELWYSGVRK